MSRSSRLPVERNKEFWEAKGSIPLWKISERMSCHENTLIRYLRKALTPYQKQQALEAIKVIRAEENDIEQGVDENEMGNKQGSIKK